MRKVEDILIGEKKQLEEIAAQAETRLKKVPEGYIRARKKGKHIEYYYNSPEDKGKKNGKYVKKENLNLVRSIIQRDYDKQLLLKANKRIQLINKFLKGYKETKLENIFKKTNVYRRELLSAPIIPDEEYVRLWETVEYRGKEFDDNTVAFLTEKGEKVRSKSEKIIADKLYMLGIPYRYEYPLLLGGRIKVYPDFTILKVSTREVFYLEHLGLMDDENYVASTIRKLDTYERNGIYLGVNLLLTYENGKMPLNTKNLDGMLRKIFDL